MVLKTKLLELVAEMEKLGYRLVIDILIDKPDCLLLKWRDGNKRYIRVHKLNDKEFELEDYAQRMAKWLLDRTDEILVVMTLEEVEVFIRR